MSLISCESVSGLEVDMDDDVTYVTRWSRSAGAVSIEGRWYLLPRCRQEPRHTYKLQKKDNFPDTGMLLCSKCVRALPRTLFSGRQYQ